MDPTLSCCRKIAKTKLPQAYLNGKHQPYVDATYKKLTEKQKHRIHLLWQEKRKADTDIPNAGQHFVRIMEYVGQKREITMRTLIIAYGSGFLAAACHTLRMSPGVPITSSSSMARNPSARLCRSRLRAASSTRADPVSAR